MKKSPFPLTITFLVFIIMISGCSQSGSSEVSSNPLEGMQVATISSDHRSGFPTTVPTYNPLGPGILMQDDFSNPESGWEVSESDYGKVGYQQGGYMVESYKEKEYYWGVAGVDYSDIRIEVDVDVLHTITSKNDAFGVDCRIQENGDGYGFRISSDGYVAIVISTDAQGSTLIDWTQNSAVYTDGRTNHLTAICQGRHLSFLVNDILVGDVEDSTFTRGDIALSVVSFEPDPVSVLFDNLIVQELTNTDVYEDRGDYSITINNPTSHNACGVYIVSSDSEYWGENLLPADTLLTAGESKVFEDFAGNLVDVRVETCSFLTLAEYYELNLDENPSIDLSEPVLLMDYGFDEFGEFPSSVDDGIVSISSGDYYSISAIQAETLVTANSGVSQADVRLLSNASMMKTGQDDKGIYGITCRMTDEDNGMIFAIRGDGEASIQRIVDGKLQNLSGWRSSEYINPGINSNGIEAYCEGNDYYLYINGVFITTVMDKTFTDGYTGLAVYSPSGASTQADFDFLYIYED